MFTHERGVSRWSETLDGLLERTGRSRVFDLMKVTVQGAELAVLQGAPDVLQNVEVLQVHVPFAGVLNRGSPTFAEYIAFMDRIGFLPFDVGTEARILFLLKYDMIFVRRESRFFQVIQAYIDTALN